MINQLKKLLFISLFNFSLFLILMIGVQNASNKTKINFFLIETINLPIGFIVGASFISGSITGGVLINNYKKTDI